MTRSLLGVCQETPECRLEYNRRWRAADREAHRARKRKDRAANLDRERARDRKRYAENRVARLAAAAAARAADPDKVKRANRRYYAANQAAIRAAARGYLRRPDRPCRYAGAGCAELASVGSRTCPAHHAAANRRRHRRRRVALAEAQGWTCTWCWQPLPRDLAGAQIDHIIPVSRGGPEDRWNLAVLHGSCNRAKWDTVTPRALELAAEHGLELAA